MISIGTASIVINNEVGRPIQGATVDKTAASIRDDSEANALYLCAGDEPAMLLVSCDIGILNTDFVKQVRPAMARAASIPEHNVILAATHMHSGPSVYPTCYGKPVDAAYHGRLHTWLVELAQTAASHAAPGRLAWGAGEARIGWNRRCCWADGAHSMLGDVRRPDFTGFEGPDDPAHLALFAYDQDDTLQAVLYNNTSHPVTFYAEDFYSADFPGEVRKRLRGTFGTELAVLYVNGAFGDIDPRNVATLLEHRETKDEILDRVSSVLVEETVRLSKTVTPTADTTIRHVQRDLELAVRLPSGERLNEARKLLARIDAGEDIPPSMQVVSAHGAVLLQETFGDHPVDTLSLHALRIGDLAFATQPCELFCQFGLDIKRRSPFSMTGVVSIADGYAGYCPTTYGNISGGYSGEPIFWTRYTTEAGYRIVEALAAMLYETKNMDCAGCLP